MGVGLLEDNDTISEFKGVLVGKGDKAELD